MASSRFFTAESVSSLDDADSDDGDAEASFDGLALLLLSLHIFSDCVNSCHPAGRGGGLCGGLVVFPVGLPMGFSGAFSQCFTSLWSRRLALVFLLLQLFTLRGRETHCIVGPRFGPWFGPWLWT